MWMEYLKYFTCFCMAGYGMSETSPVTHVCPTGSQKHGSIGIPIPNTESKVSQISQSVYSSQMETFHSKNPKKLSLN